MKPYYQHDGQTIYHGHVLDVLRGMDSGSVQCVMTSPPYWRHRDYGTPPVEFETVRYSPMPGLAEVEVEGCEPGCEHVWGDASYRPAGHADDGVTSSGLEGGKATQVQTQRSTVHQAYCLRCHGWRGSLGSEPDPRSYIAHLVLVFREVGRVLRDDGCCFVNIGDSYNNRSISRPSSHQTGLGFTSEHLETSWADLTKQGRTRLSSRNGLKEKDLIGIPWRLAFALQADGFYLRSDIVWAKGVSFCTSYSGSSMPESVRDRPSRSFEYLFLLSKSKTYYYDHIAVKEQSQGQTGQAANFARTTKDHVIPNQNVAQHRLERKPTQDTGKRNLRSVWLEPDEDAFAAYCASQGVDLDALAEGFADGQREMQDTWVINPAGSKLKHYASFPPRLTEPCIKAGSSEYGCCPKCLSPWRRVVENKPMVIKRSSRREKMGEYGRTQPSGTMVSPAESRTTGWRPTCTCYDDRYRSEFPQAKSARKRRQRQASGDWWRRVRKRPGRDHWEVEPCVVLDPFCGTGVTLRKALELGRRGIGADLSESYCEMTVDKLSKPVQPRLEPEPEEHQERSEELLQVSLF